MAADLVAYRSQVSSLTFINLVIFRRLIEMARQQANMGMQLVKLAQQRFIINFIWCQHLKVTQET